MNKCYRITFLPTLYHGENGDSVIDHDDEYIWAATDEDAIAEAKEIEKIGKEYADIPHSLTLEICEIHEVDDTQECFPEIRLVYH